MAQSKRKQTEPPSSRYCYDRDRGSYSFDHPFRLLGSIEPLELFDTEILEEQVVTIGS